jgi:hypothetical protein
MKFARLMKDDFALGEFVNTVICADLHLALVYVENFPEIMHLAFEHVALGIFEIMKGIQVLNTDGFVENERRKFNGTILS